MKPNTALKLARIDAGFTREALANALGVSTMTVYRWERGENTPNPYVQRRLSKLLQLPEQVFVQDGRKKESGPSESFPCLIDPCLPSSRPMLVGQRLLIKEMGQVHHQMIGITGLPGSGKSALAQALANLPTLRQQHGGVFWADVGQKPNHLRHLQRWLRLLGDECVPEQMEDARDRLRFILRGREILVILDDLWNIEDILPYQFPHGRYVLTTRLPIVANSLCDCVYRPRVLTEPQAFQLLTRHLPFTLAREHREVLCALCQQVGHLPLAIEQIGKYLRREARSSSQRRFQEALTHLFQPTSYLRLQISPDACSLAESLKRSEVWLSGASQQAFSALAMHFPVAPQTFSEQQVVNLIQTSGRFQLRDVDQLVDCGLLNAIGKNQYQMHPVVAAYARLLLVKTEPETSALS